MSSEKEASNSLPKRKLSCATCFDALWFCYSPVHQMQQYYRLGVLDNCSEKWSALVDCLMLKTKRASEVEAHSSTLEGKRDLMTPTNTSNQRSRRRAKTREYKSQRQRVKIFKNRKATKEGINPFVEKYWFQRYCLFSKYDEGIKMDEEGWFSVTPEEIAIRHAERCADGIVIDSFSGVGGNAIQFANKGCHVIAIDIDPEKVALAMNNAKVYGVEEYIDFIVGDFFQLAPSLKGDIVFLSPPWGGPSYKNIQTFTLDLLKPRDGFTMFQVAQAITPNIIMFLPQNTDLNQVEELSWLSSPPLDLEIEVNYVHNNLKGVTVYFGGIVAAPPRSVRSCNFVEC